MVFILSYAVFGAAGLQKPFPRVRIFDFLLFQDGLGYNTFLLISGQGILLKEMLIIVMATGHWPGIE